MTASEWFTTHPRISRGILILLLPTVPFIGMWHGTQDVWKGWKADWTELGY